ncbi:hypothetical protein JOB18_043998 [Solea senegalensis]|uniref:Reverse transcriptase n=1 Tax=Solea senegalensis TaxID=28829 RepID=A0AAV6RFN7_SOLSE|nr:hypothetical protein JOB18_043998 [Solea senegalensis]
MYVGDRPDPPPLRLGNNIVEPVESFVYLGSIVTDYGDLKPEIIRRRALAASALQSLWKPLWRHQTISGKTKLRIYNSAILSILLYGSETWPLHKSLASRLDGFDSRALRTIENIRWPQRVSNEALRAHTRQPRASCLGAAPAGLVMYSVFPLTIRREPFSDSTRGLQAGDDHKASPAPDGSTLLRATSNNMELLWRTQTCWLKRSKEEEDI